MIVLITNGRLAGKKAVVVSCLDDQYIIVAGINRVPTACEDYMPDWQVRKNQKFLTFVKKMNVNHVLATRYKFGLDLSSLDIENSLDSLDAKIQCNERVNKLMKTAYEENSGSKWLFTELKF